MANCAIYIKGLNEITYFIQDCRKVKGSHPDGWDYIGDVKVLGIKLKHFSELWTEDIPIQDKDDNWDKKVSELAPALTFKGQVVSNRKDVNMVTKNEIRKRYSLEEELKTQRQRETFSKEYEGYYNYIEGLVLEGRMFKDRHYPLVKER